MLRVTLILTALFLPLTVRAQDGLLPCRPYVDATTKVVVNQCTLMHVFILVASIFNLAVQFAGVVAIIMIMVGGYKMVFGGLSGNSDGYEDGKGTIVHALGGLLLILLSYAIVNSVMTLLFPETFGQTWMKPWQ